MREDSQKLIAELQALRNTNQALNRKSEEGRVVSNEKNSDKTREEPTCYAFKSHTKGNVSIAECEPSGKYVILKNTSGSISEDVGNYEIRRVIDGSQNIAFRIPQGLILHPLGRLKIYGRNSGGVHSPPNSIVMKSSNWGQGTLVKTLLYNTSGHVKASFSQTTVAI